MTRLPESAAAWGTPEFEDVFRRELGRLGTAELADPEQAFVAAGGDRPLWREVAVNEREALVDTGRIRGRIIAGCSCADDPTPVDEQSEYCEVQVDIDRNTADTLITLLE